jgi:hypothetical protein
MYSSFQRMAINKEHQGLVQNQQIRKNLFQIIQEKKQLQNTQINKSTQVNTLEDIIRKIKERQQH